jgi:2-C-methyl-D-erythritol 2,4-cyclodiphosphate synthase
MTHVGFGYDSHRFDASRPLVLGGVHIPGAPGLAGQSDADAALHAIIDAMLGAAGLGDIGEHFPGDDPSLAGIDSGELLARAWEKVSRAGWHVANCDVTILTERPKLSPWKPAMRSNIARLLGVEPEAVSVKAKTNEGMGPIGRGEGLAAMAVITLCADEA